MPKGTTDHYADLLQNSRGFYQTDDESPEEFSIEEQQERVDLLQQELRKRWPDGQPPCQICGRTPEDVDSDFLTIAEVGTGKEGKEGGDFFILALCYGCATGVTTSLMMMLPPERTRLVLRELMLDGRQRSTPDSVATDVASGLSGLFGLLDPNIINHDRDSIEKEKRRKRKA